jgi:hypothetical protein
MRIKKGKKHENVNHYNQTECRFDMRFTLQWLLVQSGDK